MTGFKRERYILIENFGDECEGPLIKSDKHSNI